MLLGKKEALMLAKDLMNILAS
jgi:hypothetical protein